MKRQPFVWIAVALFVGATVAGALSLPGSANDSLISQSYLLGTYLESVAGQTAAKAKSILDTSATTKLTALESQYDTETITTRLKSGNHGCTGRQSFILIGSKHGHHRTDRYRDHAAIGQCSCLAGNLDQFDDRKGRVRWFCAANQHRSI